MLQLMQVLFYNGARQDLQYRQFWCSVRPLHLLNRLQLVMSATHAAPVEEVSSSLMVTSPATMWATPAMHAGATLTVVSPSRLH